MPAPQISMRKIKELLRLKFEVGLSLRQIARALNVSLGVVSKYVNAAQSAGIGWPLPADWTDSHIRRLLFPDGPAAAGSAYAPLDFPYLLRELKRKGVTRQLLWEEYIEANPTNHYQYTQFCGLLNEWQKRLSPSMRQIHLAGDKLFVDYAGQTVDLIDQETGEVTSAQIFVAVLGASNYTFAEATSSQSLHNWIGSHVRAFEFFGAAPRFVIPDNLKSAVTLADRYEPTNNRSYQEMLEHYQVTSLPARPRTPKDKAKVEAGVLLVSRWLLARLRNRRFFSLLELNDAIRPLLKNLNDRAFRQLPGSRRSHFLEIDLPAMKQLPAQRHEYAEWKIAKAGADYHVQVYGHYYSVPSQLLREKIDVRITVSTIECFFDGQRVASHPRSERKGHHTTNPEHMPSNHLGHSEWTPQRFIKWAESIGPHTAEFVSDLIESRKMPELAYRPSLGLLSLAKRFSSSRLEAACHRALIIGAYNYKSVKSILERNLDSLPIDEHSTQTELPFHENLRGPDYYR